MTFSWIEARKVSERPRKCHLCERIKRGTIEVACAATRKIQIRLCAECMDDDAIKNVRDAFGKALDHQGFIE